jgi:ABC-type multidrug transport system ATPase subunit
MVRSVASEILAVDSVGKSFRGRQVLKAASFWSHEGRITTLLGRNGSGKTTLMRIAVGEVRANTGIVRFLSKPYTNPRLSVLARHGLYYIEERPRIPNTFSIGRQLRLIAERFDRRDLDRAVAEMALEEFLDGRAHELSGGEGRRAVLAGALIRKPACLLADEPFAGIAPKDQKMIGSALRSLAASGAAIVLSGHDVEALLDVSDEIIWCVAGTTHGLGGPAEARTHAQFMKDYLGWQLGS